MNQFNKQKENKMKKLMGISLIAALAVSPMMAMADPLPAADTVPVATSESRPYAAVDVGTGDNTSVASVAYVKGPYNAAIGGVDAAINAVSGVSTSLETLEGTVGDHTTAISGLTDDLGSLQDTVAGLTDTTYSAGNGIAIDSSNSNAISVDLDNNSGLAFDQTSKKLKANVDGSTIAVSNGQIGVGTIGYGNIDTGDIQNATAVGNQTNKLATSGYVDEKVASVVDTTYSAGSGIAIDANNGNAISVALNSKGGLEVNNGELQVKTGDSLVKDSQNGKINVKVDDSTIKIGTNGDLQVKSIAFSNISSGAIQDGATTQTNKLATSGYVTDAISSLASKTGVQKTIAATTGTATISICKDWSSACTGNNLVDVTGTVSLTEPTYTTGQ